MLAPVGKSGALIILIKSSVLQFGSSILLIQASIVSLRLCGGMEVAIPTAIPFDPFMRRLGTLEGRTTGSFSSPSKLSVKSTVSFSMSRTICSENGDILASV